MFDCRRLPLFLFQLLFVESSIAAGLSSSIERPVSVVFDGTSPSAVCGGTYTGYSFQMSMSCLAPSRSYNSPIRSSLETSSGADQLPRSSCSANFVAPWTPTLPNMLFIVKLTRLRVPAGSRLRIVSVNSFGSPTGDPDVDVRLGNLDTFRDRHGSDYIESTGTIRVLWESTNPVMDSNVACVPYALDFELTIMAYWPRWVNRTSGAYECPMQSFLCRRINYCLPKQFVGDGVNHCVDGDDEIGVYPTQGSSYPDTNDPPPFPPGSFGAGSHQPLGSFNSAVFVPLIVFVILCVFLAACIVRSRAVCRQLALRQSTFSEACRQIFCGFRSSIRMSVRPTDRVEGPPTMRVNRNNVDGFDAVIGGGGGTLRGSNYSVASSGYRRWQEQFMFPNPSPAASVNIIPKELDMSPPSYEEALKLPKVHSRSVIDWFDHQHQRGAMSSDDNDNNPRVSSSGSMKQVSPIGEGDVDGCHYPVSPSSDRQPLPGGEASGESLDQSLTSVISLSTSSLSASAATQQQQQRVSTSSSSSSPSNQQVAVVTVPRRPRSVGAIDHQSASTSSNHQQQQTPTSATSAVSADPLMPRNTANDDQQQQQQQNRPKSMVLLSETAEWV